jgi:FAD/FMN-containing dehydrogenase
MLLKMTHARSNSISFVAASGGHSSWSTIDSSGFVLDMKLLSSITVNHQKSTVKVAGAVLVKELATALTEAGRCTRKPHSGIILTYLLMTLNSTWKGKYSWCYSLLHRWRD